MGGMHLAALAAAAVALAGAVVAYLVIPAHEQSLSVDIVREPLPA